MSRKIRFAAILLLLASLSTAAQSGFAQSTDGPLNFGNNYFVTGDYVVGGAQGINVNMANGYTVGTITIPDTNPGITGTKSVPPGAQIVAALLYWQTVEKIGTVPGQPGSGENGFFRPVFKNGPLAPGYPISGVDLMSQATVAFSSGGCSGTSTGKVLRTYRADVRGYLPQDGSGNVLANTDSTGFNGHYEVHLPSAGNSTPLTLGATLVIIYRVLSPSVPLNSIVIYDGIFAQGNTSLTMTQKVQGFYDAAHNPVSRLTHIVGNGKNNKYQTVSLDSTPLPSLYGPGQPAFPGYYGTWDNPTWTFGDPSANPVKEDAASATTSVVPSISNQGCVAWGAVIVSTTVKNTDGDGLLDSWKKSSPPGYCDAAWKEGACNPGDPSWVDLTGAVLGTPEFPHKDMFVQFDYMCNSPNGPSTCAAGDLANYDPHLSGADAAITKAFSAQGIDLHLIKGYAIQQQTCTDANNNGMLCAFPSQPGVVAWKAGFVFLKNQLINPADGTVCAITTPPASYCVPRFQHGRKDSYHYALFAHSVGRTLWKFQDKTLTSVVATTTNKVTFTTPTPHGLVVNNTAANGRVTVVDAITNTNLDGTYLVVSTACPTNPVTHAVNDCSVKNTAPGPYAFTIQLPTSVSQPSYTQLTDPNLGVASGQTGTASGFSDVGGPDSLMTLGLWGADGQNPLAVANTWAHETGHSLALTHGGFHYNSATPNDYTPIIEPNCKPNFQSVMNYRFQFDLSVPDYSEQQLTTINETSLGTIPGQELINTEPGAVNVNAIPPTTQWYALTPQSGNESPAGTHCDGTLLSTTDPDKPMYLWSGSTSLLPWSTQLDPKHDLDINYDGVIETTDLHGYDDWANIDLRQVGGFGSLSVAPGGGFNGGGGGFNGGGGGFNGGGGGFNGGGGGFNGGGSGEITLETANSVARPPRTLTATEGSSPTIVHLFWFPPTFGQSTAFNIYRQPPWTPGNPPTFSVSVASVGSTPQFTFHNTPGDPYFGQYEYIDTTASCNPTGYTYFVSSVLANTTPPQESAGTNSVSTSGPDQDPLTGCPDDSLTVTTTSLPDGVVGMAYGPVTLTNANEPGVPPNPPFTWTVVSGAPPVTLNPAGTLSGTSCVAGSSNFTVQVTDAVGDFGTKPLSLQINKANTTTSASSNANPAVYGQLISFTVTVAPNSPCIPTGAVTMSSDGTPMAPKSLSGGAATFTTTLPVGTHNITATYAGDSNFSASNTSTALVQVVNKAMTTTSVISSLNPSVFGLAVTFTAAVVPVLPGAGTPTGSVTFFDGTTSIGSAPVTGGTAMLTTSTLPFGVNNITATYVGDSNFFGSTSSALSQTVKAYTTTSVSSSPNPAVSGQPVTFTATVSPVAPGVGAPTGMVNFFDGATPLGPGSLTGGVASLTTSALAVGFHSITASYLGDSLFVSSTSSSITVPVQAVVTNTADSGAGSLRQAILDVNAQSGFQSQPLGIVFNISNSGVQTITLASALPPLTLPTLLDGTTEAGYGGTPIIELNGSNAGASVAGLHITAGNSTVRGLAIYSFNGDEILIDTNGGDVIQGNYIGTNAAGTAQPNGGGGIQIIATPNNLIGGTAASMRNLISGNGGEGVRIDGTLATGNTVQGNYIGTDASGSSAVGNNASGIYIRRAPGNSVIGNVVSGNLGFAGIAICGFASFCGGGDPAGIDETSNAAGNVVQGNFVGTNFNGTSPLGNNGAGLSIDGAPNTQVGGTTTAMDNVISFNGSNDVQIFDTGAISNKIQGNTIQGKAAATTTGISVGASLTGNTLSQNSISGHTGLGIDLYPATGVVNANQPGGANNFPVITSAQSASGMIAGTLNGPANAKFTIEFFSNSACNASGNGEGAIFLGSISVTTDGSGNVSFNVPVSGLVANNTITATSTDSSGTTSEFSACVTVN